MAINMKVKGLSSKTTCTCRCWGSSFGLNFFSVGSRYYNIIMLSYVKTKETNRQATIKVQSHHRFYDSVACLNNLSDQMWLYAS